MGFMLTCCDRRTVLLTLNIDVDVDFVHELEQID